MHRFLRSIGFSHINTRQDMDKLLGIIMNEPDQTKKIALSKNHIYTEFTKEFASHAGIVIEVNGGNVVIVDAAYGNIGVRSAYSGARYAHPYYDE